MPSSWKASIEATPEAAGARRVAAVGEPAREVLVAHPVGDLLTHDHRAERDVARVDALGDREDVGDDVPVLAREPLPVRPKPAMTSSQISRILPVADLRIDWR